MLLTKELTQDVKSALDALMEYYSINDSVSGFNYCHISTNTEIDLDGNGLIGTPIHKFEWINGNLLSSIRFLCTRGLVEGLTLLTPTNSHPDIIERFNRHMKLLSTYIPREIGSTDELIRTYRFVLSETPLNMLKGNPLEHFNLIATFTTTRPSKVGMGLVKDPVLTILPFYSPNDPSDHKCLFINETKCIDEQSALRELFSSEKCTLSPENIEEFAALTYSLTDPYPRLGVEELQLSNSYLADYILSNEFSLTNLDPVFSF